MNSKTVEIKLHQMQDTIKFEISYLGEYFEWGTSIIKGIGNTRYTSGFNMMQYSYNNGDFDVEYSYVDNKNIIVFTVYNQDKLKECLEVSEIYSGDFNAVIKLEELVNKVIDLDKNRTINLILIEVITNIEKYT